MLVELLLWRVPGITVDVPGTVLLVGWIFYLLLDLLLDRLY